MAEKKREKKKALKDLDVQRKEAADVKGGVSLENNEIIKRLKTRPR
ncbi:MAG: hypothetical protein ACRDH6_02855 [Actinomycetota bacterium]